ncbi:hypothetical protein CTI12_AA479700 [Artemisia annua]|uniref:Uncharacterized protein n=1 Tax=Artemisia annua TaxID=35608 RepID=A0A2U1LEX9_ARTAN|nr:hypothetical protein CTI12_AA479700 [Artemisia annua]
MDEEKFKLKVASTNNPRFDVTHDLIKPTKSVISFIRPYAAVGTSPDEHTVASVGADEHLLFWNVFGSSEDVKPTRNMKTEPFDSFARIR